MAWWRIALMNAVFSLSVPTFVSGLELIRAAPATTFVAGTVAGAVFLSALAALTAVIGANTRLNSYMLARIAFGAKASALINLAFALSLLGWFGVNIELFGAAMQRLLADLWSVKAPSWLLETLAGVLMTALTFIGFSAINRLALLVTPLLGIVTVLMVTQVLGAGSFEQIAARGRTAGLGFGDVLSATVGMVAVGAVIMPDTCRFIRGWRGGVGVAIVTYLLSAPIVAIVGGLAGLATGQTDLLSLMLLLGLGLGAFAIVLGGSTTLNALNLYSAALSIGTVAQAIPRHRIVLLGGAGGTAFAFLNVLDRLIPFLMYLAVVFIPVGAIILVDYFLLRRNAYAGDAIYRLVSVRWPALLAWLAGATIAAAGVAGFVSITGTVAFDALLATAALYTALSAMRALGRPESAS